jgi:regulator of RNase E activity RraA
MATSLDDETRGLLAEVGTATISMQLLKRGIARCFMSGIAPMDAGAPRLVGPAYTLRYVPLREDLMPLERLGDASNAARRAIEECPPGAVLVCDARGVTDSGTIGDILLLRLAHRGVAGVVADGAVRDVVACRAVGLPVFCTGAAAPASPSAHVPADLQVPVACGGVAVFPGDVVVGDADGVVVVPAALAAEVARDAYAQEDIERFIQILVGQGRPVVGTYPPTDAVREEHGRWVAAGRPSSW